MRACAGVVKWKFSGPDEDGLYLFEPTSGVPLWCARTRGGALDPNPVSIYASTEAIARAHALAAIRWPSLR